MCVSTYVLDMVKAQRSSFASVLQRFGGKSLIMTMQETTERQTSVSVSQLFVELDERH